MPLQLAWLNYSFSAINMIVCICNNVSERDIYQAVREGVTTINALRDELGVSACCGKCRSCAKRVLHEAQVENDDMAISMTMAVA